MDEVQTARTKICPKGQVFDPNQHEAASQLPSDEFDAGFYLKRARALEVRYGNAGFHRDRYASTFGF